MAKKRGGRRPRRQSYLPGRVNCEIDLQTLATKTGKLNAFGDTVVSRTFITSIDVVWNLNDWVPADGAGPIMVGVAHFDYSLAEIEEWIESTQSWDMGDLVSQEKAKRLIRRIGVFPGVTADFTAAVLKNGLPVKTTLKFMLSPGDGLNLWVYNMGGGSCADGSTVQGYGTAHLWPK